MLLVAVFAIASQLTAAARPPEPVEMVAPEFPEAALKAQIHGNVTVAAKIGPDGSVIAASVLTGVNRFLDFRAVAAALEWRFAAESGAARRQANITFEFSVHVDPPAASDCVLGPSKVTFVPPSTVRIQGWLRPSLPRVFGDPNFTTERPQDHAAALLAGVIEVEQNLAQQGPVVAIEWKQTRLSPKGLDTLRRIFRDAVVHRQKGDADRKQTGQIPGGVPGCMSPDFRVTFRAEGESETGTFHLACGRFLGGPNIGLLVFSEEDKAALKSALIPAPLAP